MKSETVCLWHPDGREHQIRARLKWDFYTIELEALYATGSLHVAEGAVVARWGASYEPPTPDGDEGQVVIGNGRIEIEIACLRGFGLGSLLMRPIVLWARKKAVVPVSAIALSADDARTDAAKIIRNRFYEKLGFTFAYQDGELWGESNPLLSNQLIVPELKLSCGWQVRSVEGEEKKEPILG